MSVAYTMRSQCRKLMKLASLFRRDFNSSKCKTWARMTIARIKLLRNKREALVRQSRRDVALLLESRQDATARIRVEHVIREQNMMAANEILELFCERLVTRLTIIANQRDCPTDMKEAIASLIFAGPRCSDVPELLPIRDIFQKKYGKDFVSAATDLRPDCGVNRLLIEKLSALNPPGELKLKVMKEIAKEYQVEWDTTETETELLKPPEERIEGPRTFVSASSLPLKPDEAPLYTEGHYPVTRFPGGGSEMSFQDAASAAKAAADSAKNAVAAAQAAAQLAQTGSYDSNSNSSNTSSSEQYTRSNFPPHSEQYTRRNFPPHSENSEDYLGAHARYHRSQSLGAANDCSINAEKSSDDMDFNRRRHSHNDRRVHTDIKFDDSDCDEEADIKEPSVGMYQSIHKPAISPAVHPKLPDYDALTARFESLKYRKT